MTRTERMLVVLSCVIVVVVSVVGIKMILRAQEDRAMTNARVQRFCDNQMDELSAIIAVHDTYSLRDRVEHRLGNVTVSRLCLGTDLPGRSAEVWRAASACWVRGGGGDECYVELARELAALYRNRER